MVCRYIECETGRASAFDAQAVSRIECGDITWPREITRQALMTLLGVETPDELGLHPKRTRRDRERDEATKRRAFLALAGIGAATTLTDTPRRIGETDIAEMRGRFARLVDVDSFVGGADTFRVYFTELARTEQILARSTYSSGIQRQLTELAAEQSQQAGWAAFDAGFTGTAVELFGYSRRAADEAFNRELSANALIHIAYAGHTVDAVRAADSACASIDPRAPGKARALLQSRRAWSLATAGDRTGAARALDAAWNALQDNDNGAPHWCAWIDDAELDIMTGRVWSVLHEPDKAIAPLERALTTYPDHWSRDKALYLSWLADSYLDAGAETAAVSATERALGLIGKVASARPLARLRQVSQRFAASGVAGGVELARRTSTASAPIPVRL